MSEWLNHRSVSQEIRALFPAPLERDIMFAIGSAYADPHSYTAVSRGHASAGIHQYDLQYHSILA